MSIKNIFKIIFSAIAFVACFAFFFVFGLTRVKASEQISVSRSILDGSQFYRIYGFTVWAQEWHNSYTNMTRLELPVSGGDFSAGATTTLTICAGTLPAINGAYCADQGAGYVYIANNAPNCFGGSLVYMENLVISSSTYSQSGAVWHYFTLDHTIQLTPDQHYYFVIESNAIVSQIAGNTTGIYSGLAHPCDPAWGVGMKIYFDDEFEPEVQPVNVDITDLIGTSSIFFQLTAGICDGIATSTIMGDFECIIKRAIAWAFYPSAKSLKSVKDAYGKVAGTFPFSIYFDITGAITDAIATTSTSTTGVFSMPMITATGTYYMLPVASSSSLPDLIGGTNAILFRDTLSWILWILTGYLVFVIIQKNL